MQTITGEYALTEKAGLGINFYNDQAGLFKRTRAVASYAYHLPLSAGDDRLHFGVSLGYMNERLQYDNLNADPDDQILRNYNDREDYIDGDFGIAYTGSRISIQAALPNLKNVFGRDAQDNSLGNSAFFSALSYQLMLSQGPEGFNLEPKVVYRGIKGFDNILDAGANLSYAQNKVNLFVMYHTTRSAPFGLGMNYQNLNISGIHTSPASGMRSYTTGDFAISVGLRLEGKKKQEN